MSNKSVFSKTFGGNITETFCKLLSPLSKSMFQKSNSKYNKVY